MESELEEVASAVAATSPLMSSACGLQLPARMLSFGLLVALALSIITGPSIASAERLLLTRLRHEAAVKEGLPAKGRQAGDGRAYQY
jgi:hypothetical protein